MTTLACLLAVTLFYIAGGFVAGLTVPVAGHSTLVWIPAGIATASILLFGYRYWPAIVLGSFLLSMVQGAPFGYLMLGMALGNSLGAVVCVFLLQRVARFHGAMERSRDAAGYLLFACGVGPALNAIIVAAGDVYDGSLQADDLFLGFASWWASDALALLVVTPAIIIWAYPGSVRMNFPRWLEAAICAAGLLCSILISFDTPLIERLKEYPLTYLPFPFLAWLALRFGPRGAATGTLLVAILEVCLLLDGRGPFSGEMISDPLSPCGSFLALAAASSLLLAAASSERRNLFLKAIDSEKRLRLVLADQTDLICRFREDGSLTFVNPAFCEFYARTPEQLLDTDFFQKLGTEDGAMLRKNLASLPEDQAAWSFDRRAMGADDHVEWQQYNIRRLSRDANGRMEYQAVIQNITPRKRAELALQDAKAALERMNLKLQISANEARAAAAEANRANQAKSDFLANMSHEIRTPLSGILGMIELLSQSRLDPRQREFTQAANESANALLRVINDVLDFSKIEAGKMSLAHEEFSLHNIVDGVLENAATREPEKKIGLAAIIRQGVPHRLVGDSMRLRQVLLNLVGNGIKFTERGEVVVNVHPFSRTQGNVMLRFDVNDTGVGLTDEQARQLFQPFVQADTSSSRRFGGTGLGLAISRKIVELMGGRIGVHSTPGKGSNFWFELPFSVPPQPSLKHSFPGLIFTQVLVAAPNASLRESLCERFRSWGIHPHEIATPDALFSAMRHDSGTAIFPFLVCDDEMASLCGEELGRQIAGAGGNIKCILLSGPTVSFDGGENHSGTFSSILLKPIRNQSLFDTLSGILAGGKLEAPRQVQATPETEFFRRPTTPGRRTAISGLRVLAAEDNPFNRRLCQLMLDGFGVRADWATNGREAMEKFKPGRYDVVLMDGNMPEMDGHEAAAAIRHIELEHGGAQHVRIIALTANALAGEREKCLAAGMDDYLSKPFTAQQLFQALLAVAPATIAEESWLDVSRLAHLAAEAGRDSAVEMIADFTKELPYRIAEIHRLHQGKRFTELKRAAHSMKGLLLLFGCQPLASTFGGVEGAALLEEHDRIAALLADVDHRAADLVVRLQAWVEDKGTENAS